VWKFPASDPTKAAVEVVGAAPAALQALSRPEMTLDRWTLILHIRVLSAGQPPRDDNPPLWGSYRVAGNIIRFEPRFRLEPGMRYRAAFDLEQLHAVARVLIPSQGADSGASRSPTKLIAEYSPPARPAHSTTQVAHVFPTPKLLPENLLRFYICFSAPMSRGEAYRRITLVNETTGKPVDAPFLELDEELWTNDGTRFTLLIDPGRIKRGLKPREEVGPVLEAGRSYSLVIDRDWPDAAGNPLKAGFRKTFRVGPPDDRSPDPKTWTVRPPQANSRDHLEVRFPEPLDRALVERLIAVHDAAGQVVQGEVSAAQDETVWRFTPRSRWQTGNYFLTVGTELEDVAGNSVARPFEVDVAGPISKTVSAKTVALPFGIGPVAR